ncbi:MAG: hypothetical protein ABIF40_05155 [archaeon]
MTIKTCLYGLAAAGALMLAKPAFADEDSVEERKFDGSAHLGSTVKSRKNAFGLVLSEGVIIESDASVGYGPFHLGTDVVYDVLATKVTEIDTVGGVGGSVDKVNMDLSMIYVALPESNGLAGIPALMGKVGFDVPFNPTIFTCWDFKKGIYTDLTVGTANVPIGEIYYNLSMTGGVNYSNFIPEGTWNFHLQQRHKLIFPISDHFSAGLEGGVIVGQASSEEQYHEYYANLGFSLDL